MEVDDDVSYTWKELIDLYKRGGTGFSEKEGKSSQDISQPLAANDEAPSSFDASSKQVASPASANHVKP